MRFVPVLGEFIIWVSVPRDRIFGPFVALLQAGIRLSGHLECHAPAVFGTERAGCKAPFGSHGPRTERTKDNRNGSSDRIGPATGSGADRHCGRNVVGAAYCRARDGPAAAAAKSTRRARAETSACPKASTSGTASSAGPAGTWRPTWPADGRRTAAAATHVLTLDQGLQQRAP